jgi:hypothetical protein
MCVELRLMNRLMKKGKKRYGIRGKKGIGEREEEGGVGGERVCVCERERERERESERERDSA